MNMQMNEHSYSMLLTCHYICGWQHQIYFVWKNNIIIVFHIYYTKLIHLVSIHNWSYNSRLIAKISSASIIINVKIFIVAKDFSLELFVIVIFWIDSVLCTQQIRASWGFEKSHSTMTSQEGSLWNMSNKWFCKVSQGERFQYYSNFKNLPELHHKIQFRI